VGGKNEKKQEASNWTSDGTGEKSEKNIFKDRRFGSRETKKF